MMREYWNMQENLMVSAWRDGGEVDGKAVTDERLLKFWLERRDSVSKDDPLWDYYDQQHSQYKFSIEESKVGLAYAQHKMSAREVARWYKDQSNGYPQHSEMYRTIMGQAARFLDAARAQARASNAQARAKAYVRVRDEAYKEFLWPSMIVSDGLTNIFRQYGILSGSTNSTTPAVDEDLLAQLGPGAELTSLQVGNGQTSWWPVIIDAINTPGTPEHEYFYGANGVITTARRDGLDISGPFDQSDLEALFGRQMEGLDKLITVDKRFKDVAPDGNIEKYRQQQQQTMDFAQFLYTLDEAQIYSQRRQVLETVRNDPGADPFERMQAFADYYRGLGSLQQAVGDQNPVFSGALMAEMRILVGDTAGLPRTIAEGALNSPFVSGGMDPTSEGGDAYRMGSEMAYYQTMIDQVMAGEATLRQNPDGQWVAVTWSQLQYETGGAFVVLPRTATTSVITPGSGAGPNFGPSRGAGDWPGKTEAESATDRLRGAGNVQQQQVAYSTVVSAIPIVASGPAAPADAATGVNVSAELPTLNQDTTIGMMAQIPDGSGGTTPIYGIYADNGKIRWTTENPFVPSNVTSQGVVNGSNGSMYRVVANTNLANLNNPTLNRVVDPDDPTQQRVFFNPQGVIADDLKRISNPNSFIDPGFAFLASQESGRQTLARMGVETAFNTFSHSPWVDWNDPDQAGEFWLDYRAVKISQQTGRTAQSGLASDWALYQELRRLRAGDVGSDLWTDVINTSQRAALISSERADNANVSFGFKPRMPTPAIQVPGGYQTHDMPDGTQLIQPDGSDIAYPRNKVALPGDAGFGLPQPFGAGITRSDPALARQQGGVAPTIATTTNIRVPGVPSGLNGKSSANVGAAPAPRAPGSTPSPNMPITDADIFKSPTPPPIPPPYIPSKGGSPWGCFIASTLITMGDRTEKTIDQIKVGDMVLAWNENARHFESRPVVALKNHPKHSEQLMQVVTEEGNRVICTVSHRFYDPIEREWRAISEFRPGMKLLDKIGLTEIVRMDFFANGPEDVYNFEVGGLHTYVANDYVVHNAKGQQTGP
jgi:hypothetical protein